MQTPAKTIGRRPTGFTRRVRHNPLRPPAPRSPGNAARARATKSGIGLCLPLRLPVRSAAAADRHGAVLRGIGARPDRAECSQHRHPVRGGGGGVALARSLRPFGAAFYFLTVSYLLTYVLGREVLTLDKLYGAASAFLMLGILWAYFYA